LFTLSKIVTGVKQKQKSIKFYVIRSHTWSRNQIFKHGSGVGVEKSNSAHL